MGGEGQDMSTAEIVNELLQRLGDRDAEAVGQLFAEKIDWYVPGNSDLPWVGQRVSREQVPEYFHTLWPHFVDGKSIVTVEKVVIDGDDAVILGVFQHTVASTGRTFRTPTAMHVTVVDGKIVKLQLYEDTAKVSDAFFD
jgi:uncharacterized protein (TIGR02246 family)